MLASIGVKRERRKILNGGDTAATEYFKAKTSGKLYEAFQPQEEIKFRKDPAASVTDLLKSVFGGK